MNTPLCLKQDAMMNSATSRLSKTIYLISSIVSTCVFIILPLILTKSPTADFVTCSLRDSWIKMQTALPYPTTYALTFTDNKVTRISFFILFLFGGLLFEILCKNKIYTATYHLIYLFLGIVAGWFFLFACLLPYIPLGC